MTVVLLLAVLLGWLTWRSRHQWSAAARVIDACRDEPTGCGDCGWICDQFADIAAANPDLAGYGRQLPDLYLIPSTEE